MVNELSRKEFLELFYKIEVLEEGSETEKEELKSYVTQNTPKKLDIYQISRMTPQELDKALDVNSSLTSAIIAKRCIKEYPEMFNNIDSYKMFESLCDYVDKTQSSFVERMSEALKKRDLPRGGYIAS